MARDHPITIGIHRVPNLGILFRAKLNVDAYDGGTKL